MTLGQRIAEARAQAGLNQSQLADRLGLSPQSIQQWEYGKTSPRIKRIEEIAKLLNVTPEWLQFGMIQGEKAGVTEAVAEITGSFAVTSSARIPFFNVELAAGVGTHIDMEEVSEHINIGNEILERHNIAPGYVVAATVKGESMSPRLLNGDVVLINTNEKRPVDGKIYAIAVDDDLKVKRLNRCFDGSWLICSDNKHDPTYRDERVSPPDLDKLRIIGRVFMIAGADL